MPVGCDGWPLGSLSAAVTGRTRKWVPKHPRGAVVPAQEIAANQVYILTPVMTAGMLAWNTHAIISPVHPQSGPLDVCKHTSS